MAFSGVLTQLPAGPIASSAHNATSAKQMPLCRFAKVQSAKQLAFSQSSINGQSLVPQNRVQRFCSSARDLKVYAIRDGATLDRPLRVAVVGGGPAGASTAETLSKNGIETYLFERKLDNCKVPLLYKPLCVRYQGRSQLETLKFLIRILI